MSAAKSFPILDDADVIDLTGDAEVIDDADDADIDVSVEEPASETGILVRDAIARVREVARLDDKVVLPPLPAPSPRTTRVVFAKEVITAAANDVMPMPSVVPTRALAPAAAIDTQRTRPRQRSYSRFPLFVCAVVATASAIGSFLASPVAHRTPAIRSAMTAIEHRVSAALKAH